MKTLIIALNSKYIHSALAPWYLKACCVEEYGEIRVMEFSINDNIDAVLAGIYKEKADVISFSCYIWNIGLVLKLAENLKKVLPNSKVILGGPEVSFDSLQLIEENSFVDFVIAGEGERAFRLLIKHLSEGFDCIPAIEGIVSRTGRSKCPNVKYQIIDDLESIPSPYTEEMLSSLGNSRIVYFESSRGCPFSCSYCLSSTFDGVRYFSMERVKRDLSLLIDTDVTQVKFVDRTFNCNRERAKEIFKFIIEKCKDGVSTNFHFEVAADLFDEEMFHILSTAPLGLIQFEIGVQTTNGNTLEAIKRKTDLNTLFENVGKLKDMGKTHLHMDLIAGLPEEDLNSFIKSFNDVYSFNPHQLQLGFLKMLKGSNIRERSDYYGYGYKDYPPYEVLFNNFITFDQLLILKDVEEMVERYYNSGRFINSLRFMTDNMFHSAFDLYEQLSRFYRNKGFMEKPPAGRTLYSILNEFIKGYTDEERAGMLNELLKLDFLASDNSNNLPEGVERKVEPGFKEWCFDFLKNEENIKLYLPDLVGIPAKQIFKSVHFEIFRYDFTLVNDNNDFIRADKVVLFDYNKRNRVTGQYVYKIIDWCQ